MRRLLDEAVIMAACDNAAFGGDTGKVASDLWSGKRSKTSFSFSRMSKLAGSKVE